MAEVMLFHNTACSTSRYALDTTNESEVDVDVVQYLKQPLTYDQLRDLLRKLEDSAADLVRKDKQFKELGLDADDYVDDEAVATLLAQHPKLMQGPVLVKGDRAIIGRPKDRVAAFLEG